MGIEDIASWDLDNSTWRGWGEVIGTVLVDAAIKNLQIPGPMGLQGIAKIKRTRAAGMGDVPKVRVCVGESDLWSWDVVGSGENSKKRGIEWLQDLHILSPESVFSSLFFFLDCD
nr:hypothetical protein [Tanacetum cinerariifolium]